MCVCGFAALLQGTWAAPPTPQSSTHHRPNREKPRAEPRGLWESESSGRSDGPEGRSQRRILSLIFSNRDQKSRTLSLFDALGQDPEGRTVTFYSGAVNGSELPRRRGRRRDISSESANLKATLAAAEVLRRFGEFICCDLLRTRRRIKARREQSEPAEPLSWDRTHQEPSGGNFRRSL